MHTRLLASLVGLSLLLGGSVQAQSPSDVNIAAEATPSEVGTAETVTFEIRVTGAPLSVIQTPDPPSTTNLVLQESTPTSEREVSFDSGHLTRSVTFKWRYQPMQVGIGRIRPATIRVRGERYMTDEIRVRIVPQSQRPTSSRSTRSDPAMPSQPSTSSAQRGLGPRDLFIRATASDEAAYQNEQITVEYRLFFRPGVRLRQSRMADAWDAPGFWREELDVASRPTPRSTTMYGQTYEAIVLKRVALFPTRAGTLRVAPLRIETEARPHPELDQSNEPVRRQYEPVTLSSEQLSVSAASLPSNAPPAFNGAVGQFTLDTQLGSDSVEAGNAVELTARIQGTGTIATLSPPTVDPPSDFEMYEPSVDADVDRSGDAVQGSKMFRYTLVPRSNGGYTLPPITFAYFDPETEQYETLRSEPMALHVTGDVPPQAVSQTGQGLPVGEIAGPIENDVLWVQTDPTPLYRQLWAYVALLIPLLLAAGGMVHRQYAQADPVASTPSSEGLDAAQRHLRDAHRHLRDGDIRTFYQTVERAVLTFLVTRLNLSQTPSGMTRDALDRHLSRHDVPAAEQEALHELLDACDQAQFTPAEPSHESREATLDHAQSLLLRLDNALPASSPSNQLDA
jgi:hypothetical protein